MSASSDRRVKIVCTLGPSSNQPAVMEKMMLAGMDIARLNFSHGQSADHRRVFDSVRQVSAKLNRFVAVMQDLQGPKLRLGKLPPEGIAIKAGDELLLYPEGSSPSKKSTHGRLAIPISAEIAESIASDTFSGAKILFDDGRMISHVKETHSPEIIVEVEVGGILKSQKGLNLPETPLSLPCTTEKDLADLKLGMDWRVDGIALSFVREAKDVEFVRGKIRHWTNHRPLIIAKIERQEAVDAQDTIIDVSDGVLVARGDMAVELGAERVPIVQKRLIASCNELGVPIITATQMLESMVSTPTPTRAEASDVANAVFDGTDAVMLSAESASGQYPVESVQMMSKIILEAEYHADRLRRKPEIIPNQGSVVESIEYSAAKIAQHVHASAIATITHSGTAARTLSKYRPTTPIVALMNDEEGLRRLAFYWGIRGVRISEIIPTDDLFHMVEEVLVKNKFSQQDDWIVITAGVPSLRKGTTNMIKVHHVGGPFERSARKAQDLESKNLRKSSGKSEEK